MDGHLDSVVNQCRLDPSSKQKSCMHACTHDFVIIVVVVISKGEFGIVYQGLLKIGFSDTIRDTVAVKTLRGRSKFKYFPWMNKLLAIIITNYGIMPDALFLSYIMA